MNLFAKLILISILIAGVAGVFLFFYQHDVQEVVVMIEKGASASQIANQLLENDVITSKWFFLGYVRLFGVDKHLGSGRYHFVGRMNTKEVISKILDVDVILRRIVIPEGLNIRETAHRLQAQGIGDADTYIELCYNPEYAYELTGRLVKSLEGYLYPDTYFVPEEASEEFIIRVMVGEFFNKTSDLQIPEGFSLQFYEIVTLASIVEKEATFVDEMPLIASVFLNRLNIGKRLQADPTVAYALAKRGIERTIIYYVDLEVDSPFNTYRNTGLPPTPICNPSIAAIRAVLNPADSNYFYFFANNRGRHIFSRTYREHLNKQRVLRSTNNSSDS